LPRKAAGTQALVRYAVSTYARFTTGYFTSNLDNFLVGWRLGPAQLGFYKKAYDLFVLPSSQLSLGLTVLAVSALSRLQKDIVQYRRHLLSALGVMAFLGMAISGDLTLVGKDLIRVLLGYKWGESASIFTIFAPGIGMMLIYCTHIWIHLSLGHADRWFRWGLVDLVVTTVFLITGLHWHAEGIAVAWVASYWLITVPALWYAGRPIQLGISPIIATIWRYVASSLIATTLVAALIRLIPSVTAVPGAPAAFLRLIAFSFAFMVIYLVSVILLHRGYGPLRQVAGLMAEMVAVRRSTDTTANRDIDRNEASQELSASPGGELLAVGEVGSAKSAGE
jgi:PST family polysaccharide transporter